MVLKVQVFHRVQRVPWGLQDLGSHRCLGTLACRWALAHLYFLLVQ